MDFKKAAAELYAAEKNRQQIPMLTETYTDMSIDDAYKVQLENVDRKLRDGNSLIGMKIGLTSKAMQKLLNVNEPDYGHLFSNMLFLEGTPCSMSSFIQPRVEGELTFCLHKELKGPGITIADVYHAVDYVVPSIEIVDSRIKDWKIKLCDTIADNGSSAGIVLGSAMVPIDKVDMRLTGMTLERNGELLNSGTTAEVLGNPAAAVAWLANKLSVYDIPLPAGSLVMSGAVTAAVFANPGDVFTVSFQGLGCVTLKFTE